MVRGLHLFVIAAAVGCGPPPLAPEGNGALAAPPARISALTTLLPTPVAGASAAFANGRAMISGGLTSAWPGVPAVTTCTHTIHALDPDTDELSSAGTLPEPARGHLLFAVPGGDLMTAMGYCGTNTAVETDLYALRGTGPVLIGAVPVGAFYPVGGLLTAPDGGVVLAVAGGYGSGPERDNIQRINVESGSARDLAIKLPTPRPLGAGAVSGNVLYMFGGSNLGEPPDTTSTNGLSDEVVAVSMWPDSSTVVGHLPEPLMGGCAVAQSDGTLLLFGGAHYVPGDGGLVLEPTDSVITFSPATGAVAYSEVTLPWPRAGLACAVAPDDRVFLFGGAGPGLAAAASILRYEPSSWVASHPQDQGTESVTRQLRVGMACSESGGPPGAALLLLLAFAWLCARGRPRGQQKTT